MTDAVERRINDMTSEAYNAVEMLLAGDHRDVSSAREQIRTYLNSRIDEIEAVETPGADDDMPMWSDIAPSMFTGAVELFGYVPNMNDFYWRADRK